MKKLLCVACLLLTSLPVLAAPWTTIVVGQQSEPERLATVDLQRYLAQVIGKTPAVVKAHIWRSSPRPAVVLGTPATNVLLAQAGIDHGKLGAQGYHLANHSEGGVQVVIAAGSEAEGAVNAIYGLLRELGYGFYLGSEAVPRSLPSTLPDSPVVRAPVFQVRGVLPWYNFLNSPTAWDPVDHRALVDQLVRCGANFVGFHTYDHEPLAAYEEDGKMVCGGRLLSTRTPNWGTSPMRTSEFGGGADKLYAQEYFGAETTQIADDDVAIRAEQDVMRDALDYARKRGLRTCLGFEMSGNPFSSTDRDAFLKRINRLLDQYPSLDYLWIWQAETRGVTGLTLQYQAQTGPRLDAGSLLSLCAIARRDVFKRIVDRTDGEAYFLNTGEEGKAARANEAARLEQYAQLARHALMHRRNAPKLIISGWGGDDRLLSAEYYDGLDKLLPKDVVSSSLDHIAPRPRVDKIYNELPPDRQRWPIPWLENDGDQWHPQPYVHIYEGLVRDAHAGGSQGILGIHWRTRDLDENFGYLMHYAWNPGSTAEDFFQDYARRCYTPEIAGRMAAIHSRLDELGTRWVGGAGQTECGRFAWGPGEENKAKELQALRDQTAALLPKAGSSLPRLRWLISEMDWSLRYREAELAAVEASGLLRQAKSEAADQAGITARKALEILDRGQLATAMRAYAERLTTRGEHGVLATINAKAFSAWRDLRRQCAKIAGVEPEEAEADEWKPEPRILLPRLIGSVPAGSKLELAPIVLGGGPAWLHYRDLRGGAWRSLQLRDSRGWVKQVSIPASDLVAPGVEFGFSFSAQPGESMAFGPVTATVMPAAKVVKTPLPVKEPGKNEPLGLVVRAGKVVPLELTWNDLPDADYYRIRRDGEVIAETAVCMMPDCPPGTHGEYLVEAVRDGSVIARSGPVSYAAAQRKIDEPSDVQARQVGAGVILSWPAAQSALVVRYKVARGPEGDGEMQSLRDERARLDGRHVYRDTPPPGRWVYRVIPVDITGAEGAPVEVRIDVVPGVQPRASLNLPLTSRPDGSHVVGTVTFGESGATFVDGHIALPHRDTMNLAQGMTLEFEFRADDVDAMPVLISHGHWQIDGWFVQILGGQLLLRTVSGDARGPRVEPGKWYRIIVVYDGSRFSVFADDQQIEQNGRVIADLPANRDLIIGQYDIRAPEYAFHGAIRNIRLYNEPLM